MTTQIEARGIQWRQALPRTRCRRESVLVEAGRGRRVIHVGFVDDRLLERRLADDTWLHDSLDQVASSLVGIDCSIAGVEWAREQGYEAHAVDAQSPEAVKALALEPADVVVAGEVIEHLEAPGPFLRAMHELVREDGCLVVTTPNAYRPLNVLAPLFGFELIHPDHTSLHSPHTLRTLLERSGWRVEEISYYQNDSEQVPRGRRLGRHLAGISANAVRSLAGRWLPAWSDGLVVVATAEVRP
jgi:SAM-dependent methyltransferase